MPRRRILTLPVDAPALRRPCVAVRRPTDAEMRQAVRDLRDTLAGVAAYGIAAPQVGLPYRLVLARLAEGDDPLAIFNPRIVLAAGRRRGFDGCLSVPGVYAQTVRAGRIDVRALGEDGRALRLALEGLPARIVQHEIDHLDGVLFIDRLEGLDDLYAVEEGEGEEAERHVPLAPEVRQMLADARRPLPSRAFRLPAPDP